MLSASTPAFLKMLFIAAILEKRLLPPTVTLPVVGGGGLVYACLLPPTFLTDYPPPPPDASRPRWRTFAYEAAARVVFKLEDIRVTRPQS